MTTEATIEKRTIGFAPFGRHTRYMLGRYLTHVVLVTTVLLAIALTIDLWPQFELILSSGGSGPLSGAWAVVRFCALRTPWLVAPFLSFATFLGVFWAEMTLTMSGERMLVWNSGRSPLQCLAPVLLLGLILGAGEFALDALAGPASMAVQMQERLGLDGRRLDRRQMSAPSWIALPDGLLRTRIAYGPPPVLHDLTFFRRDAAGRLTEVATAATARRRAGTSIWVMQDGRFWKGTATNRGIVVATTNEIMTPFKSRNVRLDLSPLWLSMFGMETQYVPFPVLRQLSEVDRDAESLAGYRTRLNILYGETVLPGAMALLASSLSMLLIAYATSMRALVTIAFVGYMAHFATKACLLMGQTGTIPAVLAGWFVPGSLVAASVLVLLLAHGRRISRA